MIQLLIPLALTMNPILPDCVNNFTTFFNNYANQSMVDVYQNYTDVSGNNCGSICLNDTNCTSFNYFPENIFSSSSHSLCQLINTKFNRSSLIDESYVGFFLKSENTCEISNVKDIIIISCLSVLAVVIVIACCTCCNRRRRQYQELN